MAEATEAEPRVGQAERECWLAGLLAGPDSTLLVRSVDGVDWVDWVDCVDWWPAQHHLGSAWACNASMPSKHTTTTGPQKG